MCHSIVQGVHRERQSARQDLFLKPGRVHERCGKNRQQAAVGDHFAGGEVLVHGQTDAPFAAQRSEGLIGRAIGAAGETDEQVMGGAIVVQRQLVFGQRVALAQHAHEAAFLQMVVAQAGVAAFDRQCRHRLREMADHQVGLAAFEHLARAPRCQRQRAQVRERPGAFELLDLCRHEGGGNCISHRDAEAGDIGLWVEFAGRQRRLQMGQSGTHFRPQGLRPRGWLDTGRRAGHQRFADRLLQGVSVHCSPPVASTTGARRRA